MSEPPPPDPVLEAILSTSQFLYQQLLSQEPSRIYRALCDALIERTSGQSSASQPPGPIINGRWQPNGQVEPYMWGCLKTVLDRYDDNLRPEIQNALLALLKPKGQNGTSHYGLHEAMEVLRVPVTIPGSKADALAAFKERGRMVLQELPPIIRSEAQQLGQLVQKYLKQYEELC